MSRCTRYTDLCSLIQIIGYTAGLRLCATVCSCNRMKGGVPLNKSIQMQPQQELKGQMRRHSLIKSRPFLVFSLLKNLCACFRRMVEYSLDLQNINLTAIRTVRVLRPLKAINRVPSKFRGGSCFHSYTYAPGCNAS